MPNDGAHVIFNLLIAIPILLFFYIFQRYYQVSFWYLVSFFLGYLFATAFLSPDLDTDSRAYKRWGKFSLFWYLYKHATKHRGISHWYIIGTLTRLIYGGVVFFWVAIIYWMIPGIPFSFSDRWPYLLVALGGILIADCLHIILDYHTPRKGEQKKKGK